MRVLLVAAAALSLVPAAAGASSTRLVIVVWPQGRPGLPRVWTLRCNPSDGTLTKPAAACKALAAHPEALRPVPADIACTQIYGGPQVALVLGVYRGRPVLSRFNRTNGCEIGRWDALKALFPLAA